MARKTFIEQMEELRIRIWNANEDPVIKPRLNIYFTDEKLQQGQTLWNEADALNKQQDTELNEQKAATDELNNMRETVEQNLERDKKVARVALRGNGAAFDSLNLKELVPTRLEDLIYDGEQFYANLLGNTEWATAMQNFGYTTEGLTANQQHAATLRNLQEKRQREMGDAQQATKDKWGKYEELKAFDRDLKEIARIEFENDPQLLEKLGILVRS